MVEKNLIDEMIRYRARHKLSQSDLAEKCGLSTQTINSVESGTQSPSKVTEMKIWLVLEEDLNEA